MSVALDVPEEFVQQVARLAADMVAECGQPRTERWLNAQEAAQHLSLSTSQLYSLCSERRRNGLPLVKEGSRSYFRASELDAWRLQRPHR